MIFKELSTADLQPALFEHFNRYQQVTHCWRKVDGQWVIKPVAFTEQWGGQEYQQLCAHLQNTLATGGAVLGAFLDGALKGFASIEGAKLGSQLNYLDLSSIHISHDARGKGIGKQLFMLAARWAKAQGAQKLYISAHSSVETQAFYKTMGCVEAVEHHPEHVEKEPFDCQLEFDLSLVK